MQLLKRETLLYSTLLDVIKKQFQIVFCQFQEIKHRRIFARSKLEDSCLHGFYVIGRGTRDGAMQSDGSPESILTQGMLLTR